MRKVVESDGEPGLRVSCRKPPESFGPAAVIQKNGREGQPAIARMQEESLQIDLVRICTDEWEIGTVTALPARRQSLSMSQQGKIACANCTFGIRRSRGLRESCRGLQRRLERFVQKRVELVLDLLQLGRRNKYLVIGKPRVVRQ